MAITYFGSSSNPIDNGTSTAATVSVTPPSSMVAGDLAVIIGYVRSSSSTASISTTGGQTWNVIKANWSTGPVITSCVYWCTFNGTWSADPSIAFGNTTNTNVVLHVFRPNDAAGTWSANSQETGVAAPSSPFTVTATYTGLTPTQSNNMALAIWISDDDNTWGSLAGTGWTKAGMADQYRNTSGNDSSSTYAYLIQTTTAAIPNPSQNQLTLGGDPTFTYKLLFNETPSAPPPSSVTPTDYRFTLLGVG